MISPYNIHYCYLGMDIVEQVNDALSASDADSLYQLLSNPESRFENLFPEQTLHYYNCLKKSRDNNPEVCMPAY